jgi:hypothetical protein
LAEESLTGELAAFHDHCVSEARRRFRGAERPAAVPVWEGAPPLASVAHVANAVREMREMVCVG